MTCNRNFRQIVSKTTIAGFCCFCSVICFCQVATPVGSTSKLPPAIFIDGQRVNYPITYLDPNNWASLQVVKGEDSVNKTSGVIYLMTKSHLLPLTLADISRAQPGLNTKNIVYIIDDEMIKDTMNVRIDSSVILRVQAVNSADNPYLIKGSDSFGVLLISTKIKFKEPEKDQIRLQ
jgi:hypothetical protein